MGGVHGASADLTPCSHVRAFLQLAGASAASAGLAVTGTDFLSQVAASASPPMHPHGSNGLEHVVILDDTDPATVDHTGDSSTPTDGQLIPDYCQLGFRVPAIVVSNLADDRVRHDGPFEHTSTLKLIESTFGLQPITARDANAEDLGQVLLRRPRRPVPAGAIPTSSQVLGPVSDAAAICSADSVQSVPPRPYTVIIMSTKPPRPPGQPRRRIRSRNGGVRAQVPRQPERGPRELRPRARTARARTGRR